MNEKDFVERYDLDIPRNDIEAYYALKKINDIRECWHPITAQRCRAHIDLIASTSTIIPQAKKAQIGGYMRDLFDIPAGWKNKGDIHEGTFQGKFYSAISKITSELREFYEPY
jgi:hypothetical protein